jgi:hypothetical protein
MLSSYSIAMLSALALTSAPSPAADSLESILTEVLRVLAQFDPEPWTQAGVTGFEKRTIDVGKDRPDRYRRALEPLVARIAARSETASPEEAADLQLLASTLDNALRRSAIEARLVPCIDLSTVVVAGVTSLLERGTPTARDAAVARLRSYAGTAGAPGVFAVCAAAMRAALDDNDLLLPSRGHVEGELAAAPERLAALRARLRAADLPEAGSALAAIGAQYEAYTPLLKEIARRAPIMQPLEAALFEQAERELGIETRSDELVAAARAGFDLLQARLREESAGYARARGSAGEPFSAALASIRATSIPDGQEVKAYLAALDALRGIVAKDVGAAVSSLAVEVRVAPGADPRLSPHLSPEALHRRAVLLVPGARSEAPPEFRCAAAAWVFSAREGIPGRALRNEGLASPVRSFFGSAAASEGWTSYAEWLVRPWLPVEARLLSLQLELLRAARLLVADALLRGASRDTLAQFLVDQVGISAQLAAMEIASIEASPPYGALAHAGFLGWLGLDRLAAERGVPRADFVRRALALGPLPPRIAAAALLPSVSTEL